MSLPDLLADLDAEQRDLDRLLSADCWDLPTPAPDWTVRDQIGHLAFFEERAGQALRDPAAFEAERNAIRSAEEFMAQHIDRGRAMSGEELLGWWRTTRADLRAALAAADPGTRLPWYGPPMSLMSCATARIMETWAHGQDVVDALGADRPPTHRLRHVAHLGVRTLGFSFQVHRRPPPETAVHVELRGPDGDTWSWGPPDAADVVRGDALDFCLVATRRRHLADTDLTVTGPVATEWLDIAQAYAGPPGPGREPGQFEPSSPRA